MAVYTGIKLFIELNYCNIIYQITTKSESVKT